ncbi:hypothetical protein RB597_009392 [Gaeumannomyces tritici]
MNDDGAAAACETLPTRRQLPAGPAAAPAPRPLQPVRPPCTLGRRGHRVPRGEGRLRPGVHRPGQDAELVLVFGVHGLYRPANVCNPSASSSDTVVAEDGTSATTTTPTSPRPDTALGYGSSCYHPIPDGGLGGVLSPGIRADNTLPAVATQNIEDKKARHKKPAGGRLPGGVGWGKRQAQSSPERNTNARAVQQAFYTTLVVTLNLTCQNGGSNLYPPWTPQNFTDQQIKDRIFGFKLVLASEQSMLNVIYTIRACMLVMYRRLTLGPTAQRLVKYLGWYVIAGYTSTQIAFFAGCRPFYNYRAMPAPDIQCNTLLIYNIIQACFNISSDCFLLCVVIPLILQVNVPWRKKAVLLFVFSVGGSVIIAATLTKIFGFSNIWDPNYMLWYMRESSVAIFVSNTPVIWPPLRELFPCLRSPAPGGGQRGPTPRNGLGGSAWAASPSPWRRKLGLCTTSVEYKTAAASDDMEMWLNGGICSGGASTAVRQQHTSTGSSASSGVECAIPARMASSEPPGPGPTGEQRPSGSAAAPTPAPTLAPGTGVNTAEVMALNGTPSSERRGGGGGAADERNLIFPPVTHNPPSDSSGAGGGGSAIIHVVSTVEVRAEERTRSSSIVVMERAGRTDVYDWERSGVSKHRVAAHGASTPT